MIVIEHKQINCEDIVNVARFYEKIELSLSVKEKINNCKIFISEIIKKNVSIYGVNTGFGDLASIAISKEEVKILQKNIIRSHAVGIGDLITKEVARAMMFIGVLSLSKGHSGVSIETLELMVAMLNNRITPCIPEKGSVGASGDLVPLAHMALALIGEGEVIYNKKIMLASEAFKIAGLSPVELEEKEGLALINGTHFITAIGALAIYDAMLLAKYSDIAAALTGDIMDCTDSHVNYLIHEVRPQQGQKTTAKNIRKLLTGSGILQTRLQRTNRLQDSYAIRAVPQVHGAIKDAIRYCCRIFSIEINSVTDNPIIFPEEQLVISAGNFHGQPVSLASDFLSIAMSELCAISERRVARLVDKKLSIILPHFLTHNSGLNSGMMVVQYAAAAITSENKVLSHPASVDSITTSANQEDYVSMGGHAARKCREIIANTRNVLAMEFLCNTQGIEFRRPLRTSDALEALISYFRQQGIKFVKEDMYIKPYIDKICTILKDDILLKKVENKIDDGPIEC
jgi:histidine ammonia-lyase